MADLERLGEDGQIGVNQVANAQITYLLDLSARNSAQLDRKNVFNELNTFNVLPAFTGDSTSIQNLN